MKRKNPLIKSLYLFGAAIGLVVLSVFVLKPSFQTQKENKEKSDLLWKSAQRDKILEIGITLTNKNYTLTRSAETKTWIVESDGKSFDADATAVDSLISSLLGTKKEDSLETTPDRAGLDNPSQAIKVIYTDEKNNPTTHELEIGEDSPVDYQSYARWKGTSEIFMISKSLKFAIDKNASDFRNKKIFNYKLADLKEISVKAKKTYKLALGEASKWWLHVGSRKYATDAAVISDWLGSLSNSKVSSFVADDKSKASSFGFKNPAVTLNILTHKDEKPLWKISHIKNGKENKSYAEHDKSESIYEMPITFLDELQKDPSTFRNKRVGTFDKTKAQRLTYTSKDLQIELTKKDLQWTGKHTFKGTTNEGKVKNDILERILNSLSVIRAVSFLDQKPSAALGLGKTKVEIFEDGQTPQLSFEIGKKIDNDTVIWSPSFEDPILSLLDFSELFPQEATKIIEASPAPASVENKTLDKAGTSGASSATKGKIMKLEKTVGSVKELKKLPAPIVEKGAKYTGVINFKNGRKLKVEFDSDKAPYTVSNFIHLARNGFYDGVSYHRVIADFVIQGGDPTGTGRGGPGWMFDNEDNDLKHLRGSLSMAHAGRNTNGSQFFIVLKPQPHLDGLHTVFGRVTEGLDELDLVKQGDTMSTVEIYQEK